MSQKMYIIQRPENSSCDVKQIYRILRFEVPTTMAILEWRPWDVTPYGSCKYRRFGGT
jgi:hypothetical protein